MPKISNPHKRFQWSISLGTLDPFLAQEVTVSSVEIEIAEHGDQNYKVKTGGLPTYGPLTIRKISKASIDPLNNYMWDWVRRIQDPLTGGGEVPDEYKVDADVLKYATDGETIIGRWIHMGAWPSKINGVELARLSSENTIEEIEFAVDILDHQI